MFKVGNLFTLNVSKGLFTEGPLYLKVFVLFIWFIFLFLWVNATFSTSRDGRVSVRSFRWMSEFFILLIKISLIHSSSLAERSHFLAILARAPQSCSSDSQSLCFPFKSYDFGMKHSPSSRKLRKNFPRIFWWRFTDFSLV